MSSFLHEVLARFRPVAVPGAPAAAAPADREAERLSELEPVFSSLADVAAEAAEIRSRAENDAAEIRAQAQSRADALVRDASARCEDECERAVLQAQADADAYRSQVLERSHARIEAARARATPRVSVLVAEVVSDVREQMLSSAERDP